MHSLHELDHLFADLESTDDAIRYEALKKLLALTESKVLWIYDKWHLLVSKLSSDNSYQRSIGIMLLANLAKSDCEYRMASILEEYLVHFDDEKFITSRQCLQHVWKIAISNLTNRDKIIQRLEYAYTENKFINRHPKLIKQDVIASLLNLYNHTNQESILTLIHNLIGMESDEKLIKALKKLLKR